MISKQEQRHNIIAWKRSIIEKRKQKKRRERKLREIELKLDDLPNHPRWKTIRNRYKI